MSTDSTLSAARGSSPGEYLLCDAEGNLRGSLQVGWTLRRGQIDTTEGSWPVHRRGFRQVIVGDVDQPLVRLARDGTVVPGPGPIPQWSVSRRGGAWRATVQRGHQSISLQLAAPRARRCEAVITGDWEQADVVVLAACFAMLLRRRRFIVILAGGTH